LKESISYVYISIENKRNFIVAHFVYSFFISQKYYQSFLFGTQEKILRLQKIEPRVPNVSKGEKQSNSLIRDNKNQSREKIEMNCRRKQKLTCEQKEIHHKV